MKHTRTECERGGEQFTAGVGQPNASESTTASGAEVLLAQSADPLCVLDRGGTVQFISQPVERVLGYEPRELCGEAVFSYVHPDDRDRVQSRVTDVIEQPATTGAIEYRVQDTDGSWCWIESRVRNRLDDPEIAGLVVTMREITERKERERQLERENERLETFADVVAHDIRNPLQVASSHLAHAKDTGEEASFEQAAQALDRIEELVADMRTLTRQGEQISETTATDLGTVAREAWKTVETDEITLQTIENYRVDADPDRLRQLFENLFRNAVEHAGPDVTVFVGPVEPIATTTRPAGDSASGFYVADDGPGIPDDEKPDVFDSGFTTAADGTGFGLAIVARIAEAHGWEVTVTDSHRGGARFEFVEQ